MNRRKHRRDRRGVALLIILALMAMFGTVVLAFVVISSHSKRESISHQRAEEYAVVPRNQLRHAALQVLRGSRSKVSVLRPHSLLEDMYGPSRGHARMVFNQVLFDTGATATVQPLCNGQLIAFTPAQVRKQVTETHAHWESHGASYGWVGAVLTMREGPARNRSTRIVGYDAASNMLIILPFEGVATADFIADLVDVRQYPDAYNHPARQGRAYQVNGTPFSGTGFGLNRTATGNYFLDACLPGEDSYIRNGIEDFDGMGNSLEDLNGNGELDPGPPYALLPNPVWFWPDVRLNVNGLYNPNPDAPIHRYDYKDPAGPGGANEDYDAVDYQNMLLAQMNADGTVPIPSLYRPALCNYFLHQMVDVPSLSDLTLANNLVPWTGTETLDERWRAVLNPGKYVPMLSNSAAENEAIFNAITVMKLRITLRPLDDFHQYFTGGNIRWNDLKNLDLEDPATWVDTPYDGNSLDQLYATWQAQQPWDVDNDGDGQPDSIWVDLGFPVRTEEDGRRVKPLFAILCVDLDGRLNLNANGCLAHARQDSSGNSIYATATSVAPYLYANVNSTAALPRGEGYGPPEVSLAPVLDNNLAQYQALLMGRDLDLDANVSDWVDGRYGEARLPDRYSTDSDGDGVADSGSPDGLADDPRFVAPGVSFRRQLTTPGERDEMAGGSYVMLLAEDPLSRNKHFQLGAMGRSYSLGNASAFGTPPDFKGTMTTALDLRGQPIHRPLIDPAVSTWVSGSPSWQDFYAWQWINDPYELNLSRGAARSPSDSTSVTGVAASSWTDHPFSIHELERLLRRNDVDGGRLADRLEVLAANLLDHRHEVTTESWSVPSPAWALPSDAVVSSTSPPANRLSSRGIGRLLSARGVSYAEATYLLPREFLSGLRLDLNRPLGDGFDQNGNGVVDEPGRVLWSATGCGLDTNFPGEILVDQLPFVGPSGDAGPAISFDHANGTDVNGDGVLNAADRAMARQLAARHLFVLALLLRDAGYILPITPGTADDDPVDGLDRDDREELTIRRFAQWAVNMVDFRDADSIMTPFEYDLDPFNDNNGDGNPWDVDGVLSDEDVNRNGTLDAGEDLNGNGTLDQGDDRQPDVPGRARRLVWGCESPELLLTSTLAFHDRRVADTKGEMSGAYYDEDGDGTIDPGEDDDLDQPRIPQGSAFFELYCARNPNNPAAPGDLYTFDSSTSRWYLDLDKTAPADSVSGAPAYPVWRMVISEPAQGAGSAPAADEDSDTVPDNSMLQRIQLAADRRPDSTSLEPEQTAATPASGTPAIPSEFTLLDGMTPSGFLDTTDVANVQIERIVWFSDVAPTTQNDADRVYYRQGGSPGVHPDEYLIVGPRETTSIGSARDPAAGWPQPLGVPSSHRIELNPVNVTNFAGAATYPVYHEPADNTADQIKAPRWMVVGGGAPSVAGWQATDRIGISVSEPLWSSSDYYPYPDDLSTGEYGDLETPDSSSTPPYYKDEPLDCVDGTDRPLEPFLQDLDATDTGIVDNFSILDYKTVFLQRLANPLVPYNPVTNPYRTIDWMPIDLTVFNGERGRETPMGETDVHFAARERGSGTSDFNLWAQVSDDPQLTSAQTTDNVFKHDLVHTLGYINEAFQVGTSPGCYTYADSVPATYYGSPKRPFPWLTWNNRPYVNEAEALQVPASSPARLLHDFTLANTSEDAYADATDPVEPRLKTGFLPFGHLPDFLHASRWRACTASAATGQFTCEEHGFVTNEPVYFGTSRDGALPGGVVQGQVYYVEHLDDDTFAIRDSTQPGGMQVTLGSDGSGIQVRAASPGFHRMLEYLHVPSRFVGTEAALDPVIFATDANGRAFRPPFNRVSHYREPGRVNLNTMFSQNVWTGVTANFEGMAGGGVYPWANVVASRRGYGRDDDNDGKIDEDPVNGGIDDDEDSQIDEDGVNFGRFLHPDWPTQFANPFRSSAGAYLVPPVPDRHGGSDPKNLLGNVIAGEVHATLARGNLVHHDSGVTEIPLFGHASTDAFEKTDRNPYFPYQLLQRLAGTTTTRSNVYAVWITVGYFEVLEGPSMPASWTPAQYQAVFPEGGQLGPEVGSATGEVERHRAFYVFDRSIPVAFERGRDNNVEETILLERFIE